MAQGGNYKYAMDEAGEEFRQMQQDQAMTDISMPVKRAHQVLRQIALSNSTRMVEREILKEVITENNRRFFGCLFLPITLSFFILYCFSAVMHEDVPSKHIMEFPVRNALNPLLGDDDDATAEMLDGLTTSSDVWNYLENVFVPYFIREQDVYGRPLEEDQWGSFLQYNQVLGGIIFKTERGYKEPCEDSLVEHLECFPQDELASEHYGGNISELFTQDKDEKYWFGEEDSLLLCADEGFLVKQPNTSGGCKVNYTVREPRQIDIWTLDRRLTPLRQELTGQMPTKSNAIYETVYGPKGYEFVLMVADPYEKNMARFRYLKDRGWIDEHTTSLEVKLVAYNYQLAIPRLLRVKFTFYFTRGGGIYTKHSIEVSALKTFNNRWALVVDGLFLLTLMASSGYMVREFLKDMKDGRLLGHFSPGNLVSWWSCAFGWFHLAMLFGIEVYRKMVMAAIEDYFEYKDLVTTEAVMVQADNAAYFASIIRIFISYAHMLFMARCFISLQWQPRLAIITATLQASTVDLFHILIVLFPTWFGFAIAGMIMFGRRIQAFSTILSAFALCLQLAMEGEYDWAGMTEEDYFIGLLWMWIYMVLLVMIMLNMVLAIIMDVYAEVRKKQGETMTIWDHCAYLVKRAYYYKNWVPDRDLWERVSEMPATIVIDEIREAYPTMPEFQLEFLTQKATNMTRVIQREGINPTYTVQMVAAIHISLEEILADLIKLKRRGWMGKDLEVPNDQDRDCVKEILSGISVQSHWMNLTQKHLTGLYDKLGVKEPVNSSWKTVKKVEVPPPKIRQCND